MILDDPDLLFVNAGMVQFVPFFLGSAPRLYATATSIAEAIRTPHIDEVGTAHHRHTRSSEWPGNFSFGDYFKRRAIELAWALLTNPVADGATVLTAKLWPPSISTTTRPRQLWQEIAGLPPSGSNAAAWPTALVDGHPRAVRTVLGVLLRPRAGVRPEAAHRQRGPLSRSGTWCSCRTSAAKERAGGRRVLGPLPARTSTPASGWSGSRWCCKACTTFTRLTCCRRSSTSSRPGRRAPTTLLVQKGATRRRRYRIIADHSRTAAILIADGSARQRRPRLCAAPLCAGSIRSAKLLGSTPRSSAT